MRPGARGTAVEVRQLRAALPAYRAARRDGGEVTLPSAVAAHAALFGVPAAGLDVPALVERLRGLRPSQLLAVVDLAERVDETTSEQSPAAHPWPARAAVIRTDIPP